MARIWLACAALLGLAFVALLALSAHGPQLLSALFDLRPADLAGPPPAAAEAAGKPGSGLAALAPPAGSTALRLSPFEQALVVHGFHTLALGLAALWIGLRGGLSANLSALGLLAGTLLFSGSIYARALGQPVEPTLTPLGGTILLLAWALFALSALFGGSSGAARTAAGPAVVRPTPVASPRTAAAGWAAAAPRPAATAPAPGAPASGHAPAARPLPVESRHQPGGGARPAVSGPPKRPAVSR